MSRTFLQKSRHQTIYYFRRKVPLALRPIFGVTVVYKSLGTSVRREAVVLARALAAKTDRIFCEIREMAKKNEDLPDFKYTLSIDLDELTGKKRVSVNDIKPGEEEMARNELLKVNDAIFGQQRPAATVTSSLTVREAVDQFISDPSNDVKPRTRQRYSQVLNKLVEHFGSDKPFAAIGQLEFNKYAAHVTATGGERATAVLCITVAARLFKWSKIRKLTQHDITAATLKPKRKTPARHDRAAFTSQELKVLFENAAQSQGSKQSAKFWSTVASAFLGGRIEELSQLNLDSDLREMADGSWYIRIQENHGEKDWRLKQSVKKMTSWRDLPLHSALVRHGFVKFLLNEKKLGANRPFERYWTPHTDEKFKVVICSHAICNWGARELKKLREAGKITTPKVSYFHSHRHTLTSELANQGVSEEIRAAIAGQEFGGINNEVYNKLKDSPETLAPLIEGYLTAYAAILDEVMAAGK